MSHYYYVNDGLLMLTDMTDESQEQHVYFTKQILRARSKSKRCLQTILSCVTCMRTWSCLVSRPFNYVNISLSKLSKLRIESKREASNYPSGHSSFDRWGKWKGVTTNRVGHAQHAGSVCLLRRTIIFINTPAHLVGKCSRGRGGGQGGRLWNMIPCRESRRLDRPV